MPIRILFFTVFQQRLGQNNVGRGGYLYIIIRARVKLNLVPEVLYQGGIVGNIAAVLLVSYLYEIEPKYLRRLYRHQVLARRRPGYQPIPVYLLDGIRNRHRGGGNPRFLGGFQPPLDQVDR